MRIQPHLLLYALIVASSSACVSGRAEEWVEPNYDHMMGKNFSSDYLKGRLQDRARLKIRETELHEEFVIRRSDGCFLIFGVRKIDDVIEYWRVDSGPNTCMVTTRTGHLNQ